jgi:hypothetical protein
MDNIQSDVIYKTNKVSSSDSPISSMDVFSSITENDLQEIREDMRGDIINELQFAADKANVVIAKDDVVRFAKDAEKDGLRGKELERAAQKFCNKISSAIAPPQSSSRNSSELLLTANNSAVIPAGYNPEHGPSDSKTGGYMGMSQNPNTIWDSDALDILAQKQAGDEQIKESKKNMEEFKKSQKEQYWDEIQKQGSDANVLKEKVASVANVSTSESSAGNQNLPSNSMSIFSNDRDFSNIPDSTTGESIKKSAQERANKKEASKSEWNKVEPAKKVDNLGILDTPESKNTIKKNSHRESVDQLFEGLLEAGFNPES